MAKNGESLQIFFASRLVLEKWVDILIDAIEIAQSDPILKDIHWHICSDGNFTWVIQALSEKYPQRVSYYGKVGTEKMRELYRKVDFLLMPSRFLETFGLTALEALASGTPVIGIRKGWLMDFIPENLALDELDAVNSLLWILRRCASGNLPQVIDVTQYDRGDWLLQLDHIFSWKQRILLIHDYDDLIWGAEYYTQIVMVALRDLGKEVEFYGYHGKTSIWKRRLMFIFSPFALWHWFFIEKKLSTFHPDAIWMHSILRYVWVWWIREVKRYANKKTISIFLSHHDVGLIAAFPQYITDENEIPENATQKAFLKKVRSSPGYIIASMKWFYVRVLKSFLPKNTKHIIFSPFLKKHIQNHFSDPEIMILPHPVDREIFHP